MRVLTAEEMRAVDQRAIDEIGIPGLVLMENAAIGVAEALGRSFPRAETVVILCGPGNNGGDGLALARHLEARGYRFAVYLITGTSGVGGDAAAQLGMLERSGIDVVALGPDDELDGALCACQRADLVVDALFGTGLSRPLGGHFARLVQGLGELGVPLLAVDVPSGIDGSVPEPPGEHLTAQVTVTFAAPKVAHVLPPARDAMGEVVVCDLGIPSWLVQEAPGSLHLLTESELAAGLPERPADGHKGTFGHALVVAGARGTAGAAILCARAAVRSGAGLVTVAVPDAIADLVDGGSLESMTLPLSSGVDGGLAAAASEVIEAAAVGKQALALGPGLGTSPEVAELIRGLARLEIPLVLDADGLNAFAGRPGELRKRSAATVLTPHPGELGRLLGLSSGEVQADRLAAARRVAEETGAVVVLKGRGTLVAEPDGEVAVNPTGNPGMATGGSGDVLTGLLAALLAQGYEAAAAAQLAVYVHGLAGDLAAETLGFEGLAAGDLISAIPRAFSRLRGV